MAIIFFNLFVIVKIKINIMLQFLNINYIKFINLIFIYLFNQ